MQKTYWRSLEELEGTPEFQELLQREFPESTFEELSTTSRRRFLQLMGASTALAGASGCFLTWKEEKILAFAERPEDRVPGTVQAYATVSERGGNGLGLRVTSYDGRPIKVEGNPEHPASRGGTDVFAQAEILSLYDPDRSQKVVKRDGSSSQEVAWADAERALGARLDAARAKGGDGFAVLTEASSSPTAKRLEAAIRKALPGALWAEYEPLGDDAEREGAAMAFGAPYRTHYAIDQADVVLTLDADLLVTDPSAVSAARAFAARRAPKGGKMLRLYAVEGGFSVTGAMADHRLPLAPSQIGPFLLALEKALEGHGGEAPGGEAGAKLLHALADDLKSHRGSSIVAVGPRQPAWVHAVAHRVNAALGNAGRTVRYTAVPDPKRPSHVDAIRRLTEEMAAGQIDTVLVIGGNPVYDAPADLDFGAAYAKVPNRFRLGTYVDETSLASTWHLPRTHFLEEWGDARAFDGSFSIRQPLILPLYAGRSSIQLLALVAGEDASDGQALVRATFQAGGGDEATWKKTLHDGVAAGSAFKHEKPAVRGFDVPKVPTVDGLELVFELDRSLWDGRYANNGWLQELPDYMTKMTWDNAAVIGPATAHDLGVKTGDLVELTVGDRSIEIVAYVLPGQARGTVSVALGYGRTAAGQVGGSAEHDVEPAGVNAYVLRTSGTMAGAAGAKLRKAGGTYKLALVQDHHAIDAVGAKGREERLPQLIREASLSEYQKHPDFAQHTVHHPPLESLWTDPVVYDGYKWGMSIDLGSCIGCNACVIACQAENNIPIVGKEQVANGREMHWIRIDRYFSGDAESPEVAQQPVACQHCENAPCESVCPVAATVHSTEGLNDMVYNRCVGTRYCSNNCPYKVRRFNFFNYHKDVYTLGNAQPGTEVEQMKFNPEVTVRARGVMEKCTFCVQRIQNGKIQAKNEGRPLRDGEITTACAQACPAGAIRFGDLNDASSAVAEAHADSRSYALLEELNVKPRNLYLAKVTNPNPALSDKTLSGTEASDEHGSSH